MTATTGTAYLTDALRDGLLDEVEVAWSDQLSHAAGKRIPSRGFLERARGEGFAFSSGQLAWSITGQVQDNLAFASWESGFQDIHAVPDLGTARPLPWRPRVAHVIADIHDHGGRPLAWHPRTVLRSAIERLADQGITASVGIEVEFYLLDQDGTPFQKRLESYSLENANRYGPILDELAAALDGFVRLEAVETEFGPGQIEVNLRHTDPLTAADDAARLKYAVKEIARRHGKVATFMARPLAGESGSSAHLHVSLRRDDTPLFAPQDGVESTATRHVIAGLLRHLPALALFGGHTVNAYKRFEPGSWAPSTATWGGDNRSVAVRYLSLDEDSSRLEVRTGSAEANPYWLVAATLAAVEDGLRAGEEPPPRTEGNAYLTGQPLPSTLQEAIEATRADLDLAKLLGPTLVEDYARLAESEWLAYTRTVTDWELRRYLHTV